MSTQTNQVIPFERRILRRAEVEAKTGFKTRAHLQLDEGRQIPQGSAPGSARSGLGLCRDRPVDR